MMKIFPFLIFLMMTFQIIGQDCGCMPTLYSQMMDYLPLENPEDYEKDTIYLEVEKNRHYWSVYLVNRTDSIFIDEPFKPFYHNPKITIESKDSLGIWRPIRISRTSDVVNGGGINLPRNHYAFTAIYGYNEKNGQYATESRIALSFKNHVFYSQPIADSINYCEFLPSNMEISDRNTNAEIAAMAKRIIMTDTSCIFDNLYENKNIVYHQIRVYTSHKHYETASKLLHISAARYIETLLKKYLFVQLNYQQLIYDSTGIIQDELKRYIALTYITSEYEQLLRMVSDKNHDIDNRKIEMMEKTVRKLTPLIPTKAKLEALNYQDIVEIIDGEEYFKVDCTDLQYVKVRTID